MIEGSLARVTDGSVKFILLLLLTWTSGLICVWCLTGWWRWLANNRNSSVCVAEDNGAIEGSFYLTLFGGRVSYDSMTAFAVQKTWQCNVERVEGPCTRRCHRPGWLGACGPRFGDTASRCQLAWLCLIGSLVTSPVDGLISRTSMYQTGCCDYSNAAKPRKRYRWHFLRLTVFYRGGLASTAREDPSTSFWWNWQDSLRPGDQSVGVFCPVTSTRSPLPTSFE